MIFKETRLKGAYLVELEKREDHRGFFARGWCRHEAEGLGLKGEMVQFNISYNSKKGTLRGMHYQAAPYQEAKLVRCIRGAVYDVIIDLRPGSFTYRQWFGVTLSQQDDVLLYVPENFAHGYQTLADDTEVNYFVSQYYTPEAERGVRFDDPALGIAWPETTERIITAKDRNWPDLHSV
ncbi:MAG: dTDP-4-dehydrorhamnose 3,5-epimerase [Desulfatitalea sp. BRH_c12]|nr:MAG: dTDP-4-dehydrorhamnose 3,5-epimerase [Desulfatitalea sp. BRH_c12]